MSWASSQVRDASLIGLCLATGVIQTLIALIILYGWEKVRLMMAAIPVNLEEKY